MGIAKTLARLQANFWWEGMRNDVKKFIMECSICQQMKYETKRTPGLLQPLPIPTAIWEDLSLDFITGLPPSHNFTAILVVVNRFPKGVHLASLHPNFTAHRVASVFFNTVCKIHGIPRSLVSDRDPLFISKFWRNLFSLCGTKLQMSTSYHPETDGQIEVFNRVLEQYLRSFVHTKPSQWSNFLPLAEWSYNTSVHSSTRFSPYQITFGKEPPSIPRYLQGSSSIEAVDTMMDYRQQLIDKLRRNLLKTQEKMKYFADQKHRDVSFHTDQFVYVRMRPYRQKSITNAYTKLSKHFYGPFHIIERIGQVAYRLELPPHSKIHPVFHCSLLKPHHGPVTSSSELPPSAVDNHPLTEPLVIIDRKMDNSTDPSTPMVLVQWKGLALEDTSWEEWKSLHLNYHLEDKVIFQDPGDVSIGPTDTTSHSIMKPKRLIKKASHLKDYVTSGK